MNVLQRTAIFSYHNISFILSLFWYISSSFGDRHIDSSREDHISYRKSAANGSYKSESMRNMKGNKACIDYKTIKMCISLTVLYFVSFLPLVLNVLKVTKSFFILYFYFTNHIGNPVIYCLVNNDFRNEWKFVIQTFR